MKGKLKTGIENMKGDEIIDMITSLLAQPETVRIIFEKDERKNEL